MKNIEKPIVVEQIFNSPINRVWESITKLDLMKKWFFNNIPSFETTEGFKTRFDIQVEDRVFPHLWKVIEVIPNSKISIEWQFEGFSGIAIVDFELTKLGNQTKLRLTSTVIENFPDNIPEFKRESGVEGWNYFIKKSLNEYLKNN